MGHQIFGERFMSLRVPAWHSCGYITETEMTAREALTHIDGDLNVRLHPNFTEIEGELIHLPGRSIVRYPTRDDAAYAVLGQVGPEYTLISPGDMADIWDDHVGRPIETMGILRRGAMFFCTTKLPALDIKGDEVEQYLGVTSPLDGVRAASAEVWGVRTVCANTLKAAQASAQTAYRVIHTENAQERIGHWLHDAYEQAEANYAVLKETFELLANRPVSNQVALSVLRRTYPELRRPRREAPDDVMDVRLERWERAQDRLRRRRESAMSLFEGDGTGMDTLAAKGTLWGLYNSVTETECYRKGFARGGVNAEAARVGEDVLFGSRGETMQRCFNTCLSVAHDHDFDPTLN